MPDWINAIILALIGLATGVYGHRVVRKNARDTTNVQQGRLLIEDRDGWIKTLREDISRLTERVEALEQKNEELDQKVDEVEGENRSLISYIYRLWTRMREHSLDIPDPPEHLRL
jgi:predicted RNase H-like nuclease (RuvC/YqgF family)